MQRSCSKLRVKSITRYSPVLGKYGGSHAFFFSGAYRVPLHPVRLSTNHNRRVCREPTSQSACTTSFVHTKPIGPCFSDQRTNQSSQSQTIYFSMHLMNGRVFDQPTTFRSTDRRISAFELDTCPRPSDGKLYHKGKLLLRILVVYQY